MYSLEIDSGTEVELEPYRFHSEASGKLTHQFNITCDGEDDLVNYKVSYVSDGLKVHLDRCKVTVEIEPNLTQEEQYRSVIFQHCQDPDINTSVSFKLIPDVFELMTQSNEVFIDEVVNKKSSNVLRSKGVGFRLRQYIKKKVVVTGGSKKFRVLSIYGYKKIKNESGEVVLKKLWFDNSFNVSIFDDTTDGYGLLVENYGRVNKDADYYVITLYHKDDKTIKTTVTVRYNEYRAKTSLIKKGIWDREKIDPSKMVSITTPQSSYARPFIIEPDEKEIFTIVLDNSSDEVVTIVDKEENVQVGFNVLSDGKPSDRMVSVVSNSLWCRAQLDESNREFFLTIKDWPGIERTAEVKVYMVDDPTVFKIVRVVNKPSDEE